MIFIKTTLAIILSISVVILMFSGKFKTFMRLFLVLFYLILLVFIAAPPLSDKVANFFGIGTGKDMIIYLSIAIIWFLTSLNHAKIKRTERHITELVRKEAINNAIRT
jgi:hypothetical protein